MLVISAFDEATTATSCPSTCSVPVEDHRWAAAMRSWNNYSSQGRSKTCAAPALLLVKSTAATVTSRLHRTIPRVRPLRGSPFGRWYSSQGFRTNSRAPLTGSKYGRAKLPYLVWRPAPRAHSRQRLPAGLPQWPRSRHRRLR